MGTFERRVLNNRTPRGGTAPGQGVIMLVFSLPFIGVGVFLFVAGAGWIEIDRRSLNGPPGILQAAGAVFALAGFALGGSAVAALRRAARAKQMLRLRPHEPWMADYPWDRRGARDNNKSRAVNAIVGTLFFALFMCPFVWWAFISDQSNGFVKGIVGLFLLIWLLAAAESIRRTGVLFKYGTNRLAFAEFPYRLGGRLEAVFIAGAPVRAKEVKATLRLVEEVTERRRRSRGKTEVRIVSYELYRDELTLDPAAGRSIGGRPELTLAFDLPEGDWGTRFQSAPPRYWEIAVSAETPGFDLEAEFLVPVYADETA